MCANSEGSGETARDAQARLSHRWDSRLCDKYQNLLSWLQFHSNQEFPKTGDHSYVGPSPNQYGPPVWRKPGALASQLGTDAWTKTKKKKDGKYNINIRVAGEVVWLR